MRSLMSRIGHTHYNSRDSTYLWSPISFENKISCSVESWCQTSRRVLLYICLERIQKAGEESYHQDTHGRGMTKPSEGKCSDLHHHLLPVRCIYICQLSR